MNKSGILFRPGSRLAWFHAMALSAVLWAVLIAAAVFIWRANVDTQAHAHAQLENRAPTGQP